MLWDAGRGWVRGLALPAVAIGCLMAGSVRAAVFEEKGFQVTADFRVRFEGDWDSLQVDGEEREDRTRLRVRARIGFKYAPDDRWELGVRLRTGSDDSQQSGHITIVGFDEFLGGVQDTGSADFNFDLWYLKAKTKKFHGWIGRNKLPFWRQNVLFWDDDATVAGLGGGWKSRAGENGTLAVSAGYFSPPAGMRAFVGSLGTGQIVYEQTVGQSSGFTIAPGLLWLDGDPEDPHDALLLEGNGSRDYTLWVLSMQGRVPAGKFPLKLGVDVITNTENYPDVDPMAPGSPEQFTYDNRDETDGLVLSVVLGDLKKKGHWLAGYYYSHIETLAVNNSFSQDDWMRWGSSTQTRGSNFKGHEFRFAYGLGSKSNLIARLYIVEALTTIEDGKRFRVDLNRKF